MRFEDAYEGWTEKRLTQIDAAQLPGVCPLDRLGDHDQELTEDLSVAA